MNIALWIIQIFLAAVFLTLGSIKAVFPKDKLTDVFEWSDDFSENKIKIIGAFEIIGALSLFLPGVFDISTFLIPLSAAGLAIIMVLAVLTHYNRGEKKEIIINIVLFVLLSFVVIVRLAW